MGLRCATPSVQESRRCRRSLPNVVRIRWWARRKVAPHNPRPAGLELQSGPGMAGHRHRGQIGGGLTQRFATRWLIECRPRLDYAVRIQGQPGQDAVQLLVCRGEHVLREGLAWFQGLRRAVTPVRAEAYGADLQSKGVAADKTRDAVPLPRPHETPADLSLARTLQKTGLQLRGVELVAAP